MFRTAKRERTPIISATLVTIGIVTLSGSMLNLKESIDIMNATKESIRITLMPAMVTVKMVFARSIVGIPTKEEKENVSMLIAGNTKMERTKELKNSLLVLFLNLSFGDMKPR